MKEKQIRGKIFKKQKKKRVEYIATIKIKGITWMDYEIRLVDIFKQQIDAIPDVLDDLGIVNDIIVDVKMEGK